MSLKRLLSYATLADKLLFSILLGLSLTGIIFVREAMPKSAAVRIEANGKSIYLLPLDKDRTVSVEGPEGITFVQIKDSRVRITGSPCPNKLCIKQGWMKNGGLVCLPNKVVITIDDHKPAKKPVDAITG